jgi:hypothetical protein
MEVQELLDKEMLEEQHLVLEKVIELAAEEELAQRAVKGKLLFQLLQVLAEMEAQDGKYL